MAGGGIGKRPSDPSVLSPPPRFSSYRIALSLRVRVAAADVPPVSKGRQHCVFAIGRSQFARTRSPTTTTTTFTHKTTSGMFRAVWSARYAVAAALAAVTLTSAEPQVSTGTTFRVRAGQGDRLPLCGNRVSYGRHCETARD